MKKFATYHLPLLVYACAMLAVSAIPNLKTPGFRFLAADKVAHMVEYAIFALLSYRSMSHLRPSHSERLSFLLSLLLLSVFGLLHEFLQRFIPGRKADLMDYLADLAGGVTVLVILYIYRRRKPA